MRIAMLGGTFDPIHYGHMALGKSFADCLGLDRVLIIPTKLPPHKDPSATSGEQRLEMCRLAAETMDERFEASDIELRFEGKSYSYNTVCKLLEMYPQSKLHLLVGIDMFMTLQTWYRFDELKELVTFCAVPRGEVTAQEIMEQGERLVAMGCSVILHPMEQVPLSSTMIRERMAKGESISEMVPPEVERYIKENGLYSAQ